MNATPPGPSGAANGSQRPSHPVPAGMRDWLPQKARRRADASERILRHIELCGYQRVEVPPFEYAEVLERGFGNADDSLRFIEPETGKIASLRSDVTPQIARLISTRFADGPWPARLCYRDSVLRRRRARARLDQNLLQVGFELAGPSAESGDLEVLETATSALRASGLDEFTVDLAHAEVPGALLERLAPRARSDALECLAVKDSSQLARVAAGANLDRKSAAALAELCELHGGNEIWPRAERALADTPAEPAMRSLKRIWDAAVSSELASHFVVDLGETREFYYYTGAMFHLLAEGPGEPLGSGGRYDTLFERFDLPCPAAGFAFDIGNVCWALEANGITEQKSPRVLVGLPASGGRAALLLRELRARGLACALGPEGADGGAYGRQWDYTHVLDLKSGGVLRDLETGAEWRLSEALGGKIPEPMTQEAAARLAEVVSTQVRVLEELICPA